MDGAFVKETLGGIFCGARGAFGVVDGRVALLRCGIWGFLVVALYLKCLVVVVACFALSALALLI